MKKTLLKLKIKQVFKAHKNGLPTKSEIIDPKMEYHFMADGVFWEDEGLRVCHPELENCFRYVINYRTRLISDSSYKNENSGDFNKKIYDLAKRYFTDWIGFEQVRCSFEPQLADRIKRIRKVSDWKIDQFMDDLDKESKA